jgi:hypothetical protein
VDRRRTVATNAATRTVRAATENDPVRAGRIPPSRRIAKNVATVIAQRVTDAPATEQIVPVRRRDAQGIAPVRHLVAASSPNAN